MDGRVPDDALFADLLPAGLKLGLDEAQDLPRPASGVLWTAGQDDTQGDKRNVDDGQVQRLSQILRRDIADVRPLHADDPAGPAGCFQASWP